MATTIISAFQQLQSNLEISGLQRSTVSSRQQNVREALEGELVVLDSFLTGSYSRATMIAPLNEADIDVFVVLDSSYFESDGQANLLDKVRRVLIKTYPQTPKISRNGQAVTVTFSDFIVDVVPAFNRKGGGYLIPNSVTKEWVSTNPKTHVELMNNQNGRHDDDLVPLVKMIKGWNRDINHAFVSFYLELITIEILHNATITDFSSGMRFFLDKGRERIKTKVNDPVPFGGQINGLRNARTVDDAVNRFTTAYNRARLAEQYATDGRVQPAIEEWSKIFGAYFPAYG